MHSIDVALAEHAYKVHIGSGLLPRLGELCRSEAMGPTVAVVADEPVAGHYLERTAQSLQDAGFQVHRVVFSGGDAAKSLGSVERICGQFIQAGLDRSSWVVALGGGVVGDLAGFVAATYMRGIDFVQVPTSLVAQVDASVGGKTAVNHALGKNMVGAFHQPRLVLIDTETLSTLPHRELVGGMGEVIKHAVSRDVELFAHLEGVLEQLLSLRADPAELEWLIGRNVAIKAAVVAADERESGLRAVLNYGHTVGHAIEAATGYSRYRHGEAVAMGMAAAGEIAVRRGLWPAADRDRQDNLLRRLQLRWDLHLVEAERILQHTRTDKKRAGGRHRFVLPCQLGSAILVEGIEDDEVRAAIGYVQRFR